MGSTFITMPLLSDVIESDSFCFLSPLLPIRIDNLPSFGHGGKIVFFKNTECAPIFSQVPQIFLGQQKFNG